MHFIGFLRRPWQLFNGAVIVAQLFKRGTAVEQEVITSVWEVNVILFLSFLFSEKTETFI